MSVDFVSDAAAGRVLDNAHESICAAVDAAHEHIASAADAIEQTAKETTDAAILSSLADLHAAVRELATRQSYDPGELASINSSLERLHGRMDAMAAPATESAAAAEDAIEAAIETIHDELEGDAQAVTGTQVEIPDPTELPAGARKAKKKLFGKKK